MLRTLEEWKAERDVVYAEVREAASVLSEKLRRAAEIEEVCAQLEAEAKGNDGN